MTASHATAPETTPAVLFDGVTRRHASVVAVDDLSLTVSRGEMVGIIGPDGAGKTTTIRLACGLLAADRGRIRILGHDPVRDHRAVTRRVGYLSQNFSLYGDLTIDENIAFFAEIHGVSRYHERRERLLDMTQLTPFRARRADRLSGGMRQKLALSCTLVHEPDVILLDEPTTGVDPVSRREFWKLLAEFLEQGITIVMTTPYLDEAERCSRVALLHRGRLLAVDRPSALRDSLPGLVMEVIARPARDALETLESMAGVADVQAFGERAHVRLDQTMSDGADSRIRAALRDADISVVDVRPVRASLEDVFIERIATADRDARQTAEVS
jgi:ABC-2 type transport system ATP-binding protein